MAKEAFHRKVSLLISKLIVELRKKLVRCCVWSIECMDQTPKQRKLKRKYLENFEMWRWSRMENMKWSEIVTDEQVLKRIGEKRTLLNNILSRKANSIGHNLRSNCLLREVIKGQMQQMKGIWRRTRLLDYLRNRRRYWELKEKADDQKCLSIKYKKEIQVIFHRSTDC